MRGIGGEFDVVAISSSFETNTAPLLVVLFALEDEDGFVLPFARTGAGFGIAIELVIAELEFRFGTAPSFIALTAEIASTVAHVARAGDGIFEGDTTREDISLEGAIDGASFVLHASSLLQSSV
mmetsp:Transcript_31899/g.58463  ORF Transcript_31899/g.58463 Transcript_31899/m.58463 type:complete len:124 (+) Transcript_31899:742-1113(+)